MSNKLEVPPTHPLRGQKKQFLRGIKSAVPIVLAYVPVAVSFGVIAIQTGIPLGHTISMSIFIYAGASQFMAVSMLGMGAGAIELVIATFVLNSRHFILSMALMNRLPKKVPVRWKGVLSYGLTDETFAVSTLSNEEENHEESGPTSLSYAFLAGLFLPPFLFWVMGTWLGGWLALIIPPTVGESMAIALYAMFIGLLVPALKRGVTVAVIAVTSAILSSLLIYLFQFNNGWAVVVSTLIASLWGILLFKEEDVKEGE